MSGAGKKVSDRKANFYKRILELLEKYSKVLLATADNVGSFQMQNIRKELRGKGTLLMGKNTLIRRAMREHSKEHPEIEPLIAHVYGNCGLIFTNDDLASIRNDVSANKVGAYAKAGSVAPCQVIVPAGSTGLDPGKTSFFQALSIQTKINRGKVEIISDVKLLEPGEKVNPSQAVLLQMLNIKPFEYYLRVSMAYENGSVFNPKILDQTDNDILQRFKKGISRVTALGLAIGHASITSVPFEVARSFEHVLAVSIAAKFKVKQSEEILNLLEDPEKLAALQKKQAEAVTSAPAVSAAGGDKGGDKGGDEKKGKKGKGDDDDDEDDDGGGAMGGLFGGGGSDEEEEEGGGGAMGGMFGGGGGSDEED